MLIAGPVKKLLWIIVSLCCVAGLMYNIYAQGKFQIILLRARTANIINTITTIIIIISIITATITNTTTTVINNNN